MPIRFFCEHCKQMLKIGTSKAGSVVECPRCKQSLVIPPQSSPQAEEAYRLLKHKRAQTSAPPADSTTAPIPSWEALEEEIDDVNMPLWMEESWIPSADSQGLYSTSVAHSVLSEELSMHVLKKRHNLTVMLLSVSLVVAFFVGITFGILIRGFYMQPSRSGQHADASGAGTEVAGTLYYVDDKNGMTRGDAVAAIICLPKDRPPGVLLSCQGLRPGDVENSDTIRMIHELGGMYEIADNNGVFSMPYQSGVRYLVILISANQKSTDSEIKPGVMQELRRYFRDPELFGGFCVHIDEHEWGTPTLRHTF